MSRVGLLNFSAQDPQTDGCNNPTFNAGVSYDTVVKRTGPASLKIVASSGSSTANVVFSGINLSGGAPKFFRWYVNVDTPPSTTARVILGQMGGGMNIRLNPDRTLSLYNGTSTLIGTTITALTGSTTFHCVELAIVDGTTVDVLWINGVSDFTASPSGWTFSSSAFGVSGDTVADTYTVRFADVSCDNAERCGPCTGIGNALPISDNARAAKWTGGAGGTTNLYDAVNDTPPTGLTSASATNTSQIEHAGSGAGNEDYDANLTTYSLLGVAALAQRYDIGLSPSGVVTRAFQGEIGSSAAYWSTSFTAPASGALNEVMVAIAKIGTPTDDHKWELWSDNGAGKPNAKISDIATWNPRQLMSSGTRYLMRHKMPAGVSLVSGTRYHIIGYRASLTADSANYVNWYIRSAGIVGENSYPSGDTVSWLTPLNTTFSIDLVIGAGDVVRHVLPVLVHGEDIATGTKTLTYLVKSNPPGPVATNFSAGQDIGAIGTYPTNWKVNVQLAAGVQYPNVTPSNSPVMSARRPSTESRVASVAYMAMLVEWDTYAATGTQYTQNLSGAVASAGGLGRQARKALTNNVASSAGLLKRTDRRSLAASIGSGSTLARRLNQHPLTGSVANTGTLSSSRAFVRGFTGGVISAGILARQARKTITGNTVSSGGLVRLVRKESLSSLVASTGALARQAGKRLLATVASSSVLTPVFHAGGVSLTAAVASAGAMTRRLNRSLSGGSGGSGALARQLLRRLTGSVTSSAGLAKTAGKSLVATVTSAGSILRLTGKALAGSSAAAGVLNKALSRGLTALVPSSSLLHLGYFRSLTATVASAGALPTSLDQVVPDEDISNLGWHSTEATFYAPLADLDVATYIYSDDNPVDEEVVVGLEPTGAPEAGELVITFQARSV